MGSSLIAEYVGAHPQGDITSVGDGKVAGLANAVA